MRAICCKSDFFLSEAYPVGRLSEEEKMEIESLEQFFAEYTPLEQQGKAYYQKAVRTKDSGLTVYNISTQYQTPPLNVTRPGDQPIAVHRHERYVPAGYHAHAYLEIMYQFRGRCMQNIEGESMVLKEGELCFISPGVFHDPAVYDDSVLLNILIRPDMIQKIDVSLTDVDSKVGKYWKTLLYSSRQYEYLRVSLQDSPGAIGLLDSLVKEYFENKPFSDEMIQAQFLQLLYLIMRKGNACCVLSDQQHGYIKKMPVLPILQYIQDHADETVTLGMLSERFSYSEQHICRMIRLHTGRTFSHLLMDFRLSQAKLLLVTTELSFHEIAWRCGYAGNTYFHRLFVRQEGMTPMEYRRRYAPRNSGKVEDRAMKSAK